jgi:elongator complex protein 4
LLRYYAAEGLVQGHQVHVIGVPDQWGRELPGLVAGKQREDQPSGVAEKMKIAWRYERLGQLGTGTSTRGGLSIPCHSIGLAQCRNICFSSLYSRRSESLIFPS